MTGCQVVYSCAVRLAAVFGEACATTAAGSKISHKIRHCACQSVKSGRSVKSDYLSSEVLP